MLNVMLLQHRRTASGINLTIALRHSLGGLGINLYTADIVVLFDSDW